MNKLFDSIAFRISDLQKARPQKIVGINYDFRDSEGMNPYVRITVSIPSSKGDFTDIELDITREDMVDLLNEVIDEWPEIVDYSPVRVKRGVRVLPTFC